MGSTLGRAAGRTSVALVLIFAVSLIEAGCVGPTGYQSGPVIDRANVDRIRKGTTTMAEVQALFGPPASVALMGDGRRMAVYFSIQTQSTPGSIDPKMFIPIVGPVVATNTAHATQRQQQLQIIYTSDGIVQDFEFSDSTSSTDVSTQGGSLQMNTTPAAAAPGSK